MLSLTACSITPSTQREAIRLYPAYAGGAYVHGELSPYKSIEWTFMFLTVQIKQALCTSSAVGSMVASDCIGCLTHRRTAESTGIPPVMLAILSRLAFLLQNTTVSLMGAQNRSSSCVCSVAVARQHTFQSVSCGALGISPQTNIPHAQCILMISVTCPRP